MKRNPCPETYGFRATGTSSNYEVKSPASAGDKVIVIHDLRLH